MTKLPGHDFRIADAIAQDRFLHQYGKAVIPLKEDA